MPCPLARVDELQGTSANGKRSVSCVQTGYLRPCVQRHPLDSTAPRRHDRCVPIYDFTCEACEERFEELLRSDAPAPPCPACNSVHTNRELSTFLTPNITGGQRRFVVDIGSKMSELGCCGGGGCGTHAG